MSVLSYHRNFCVLLLFAVAVGSVALFVVVGVVCSFVVNFWLLCVCVFFFGRCWSRGDGDAWCHTGVLLLLFTRTWPKVYGVLVCVLLVCLFVCFTFLLL